MPHIPSLDGLRGVAVAAVLLFHAGHLSGGFLGVDLFFTLSGFLITSLLLLEHRRTGSLDVRRFWARRFRRLMPALLLVLAAVALYGYVGASPTELGALRRDGLATLGYVANWFEVASDGDYWAAYEAPSPLAHTWSLAIEEQFYVAWPVLLSGLLWLARGRRWPAASVTITLAAASVAALVTRYEPGGSTSRAYFGTDTRLAAILYGAIVAFLVAGRPRSDASAGERRLAAAALPIATGLVVAWVLADGTDDWLYRWGFPLLGTGAAVMIAVLAGPRRTALHRVLELRLLRHLGVVSYGLYLWHWPVYVVLDEARTGRSGPLLTVLRVAVSLVLAEVSYRFVEHPVRTGRAITRGDVFAPAGAVAVAFALVVGTAGGVSRSLDRAEADTATMAPSGIAGEPRLLLVGDSGASLLGPGLAAVGRERGVEVLERGVIACGILRAGDGLRAPDGSLLGDPPGCDAWPERWAAEISAMRPDAALLVLAWGGIGERDIDGSWRQPCDPRFDAEYEREVIAAIDVLAAAGRVFVATLPYNLHVPEADTRVDCLNRVYQAGVAARPEVASLVELAAWTCPDGSCRAEIEGVELRPDGAHFEGPGSVLAGRWVLARLVAAGAFDDAGLPLQVMVIGDSQAFQLATPFADTGIEGIGVSSSSRLGCGVSPGLAANGGRVFGERDCSDVPDRFAQEIDEFDPDVVVLNTGAWEVLDRDVDGGRVRFGTPEWDALSRTGIARVLDVAAGHERTVVALTAPCFDASDEGAFPAGDRNDVRRVARWNELLRAEAARRGVEVLDYFALLCPDGVYEPEVGGVTPRDDGVHLNAAGARLVWEWLAPQLVAAARR